LGVSLPKGKENIKMDDKMADSEMLGDIQSDGYNAGCKEVGDKLTSYIESIKDWLRNFAEDQENRKQLTVDLQQQIWNEIQSIDHDIETKFQEVSSDSSNRLKPVVSSEQRL